MDEVDKIITLSQHLGVVGLSLLFVYALLREYVVIGTTYRRELAVRDAEIVRMKAEIDRALEEKDEWKDRALTAMARVDQTLRMTEPAERLPELPEPERVIIRKKRS